MIDITTIGEILIDLTQTGCNSAGIPQYSANPGGAPANLAVAASRLGASTTFIGKVGADAFGNFLTDCLKSNQVDTSYMLTDSHYNTTLAIVSVSNTGERSFSFYRSHGADTQLTIDEVKENALSSTRFLHFGSVSLTTEPCSLATIHAVQTAKKHGALISYDPNYRASLWSDEATAIHKMKEPLSLVDILKVSDEELPLFTGTSDLEAGSRYLSETYGISLILITLGADGAFYRFGELTGTVAGVPCKVADTNGAGDTFFGAALAGLVKLPSLTSLTKEHLENIIAYANRAASLTTSRSGAIPAMPYFHELEEKALDL